MKAAASISEAAPAALCVECSKNPRLAALSRCRACIGAAAAVDRDSRLVAEARVSAKKQRQAALEALGDAFLTFASTPEGQLFLQQQQAELIGPRNDPEYVNAALERDRQREIAANEIAVLHHIVQRGRSHGTVTFKNDRDLAKTREAFRILQNLFEAKLYCHPDPHDNTGSVDYAQRRPPKHEFGREARSLGNRGAPPRALAKRRGGGGA